MKFVDSLSPHDVGKVVSLDVFRKGVDGAALETKPDTYVGTLLGYSIRARDYTEVNLSNVKLQFTEKKDLVIYKVREDHE